MTYNVRIDEKDWARCGRCSHKLFEVLGDMGDVRIKCHSCKAINITERRMCNNCKWNNNGICMNDTSVMFLQQKLGNEVCEQWEKEENRKIQRRSY